MVGVSNAAINTEGLMAISIGTSQTPSVRDTHAAWLRLREDGNRPAVDAMAGTADGPAHADRTAVLERRDVVARMIPRGIAGALI
ncbi:hypothetical protein BC793_101599 [Actinoplanes xinjiangensis]|uniref:Uncharacterized protein n=2 Tax=Actinoplanes xinjiangensis TaxID=512350 RepID=A0A316FYG8_9ACTN|nr:hypothetical protein BC793_101599 [Actinoplanes xinjiangensis]GIF36712.1 hypothetical protein Axi01nite_10230 [Actinoplanes xinjiangensis]